MSEIEGFEDYLLHIENPQNRDKLADILQWVPMRFPNLKPKFAWNQPMFTDHGTFIIGFSVAKQHIAVAPEKAVIAQFSNDILRSGYGHSSHLMRIKWAEPVDFTLLERIIQYSIADKADCTTFWRK